MTDFVEELTRDLADLAGPDAAALERLRARTHALRTETSTRHAGRAPRRSLRGGSAWRVAAALFVLVVVAGGVLAAISFDHAPAPSHKLHSTLPTSTAPTPTTNPVVIYPRTLGQAETQLRIAFEDSGLGYVDISSIRYVQTAIVALKRPSIDSMFPGLEASRLPHAPAQTVVWIFLANGTFQQGTGSPCSPPYPGQCGPPFGSITMAVVAGPVGGIEGPVFGNAIDLTGLGPLRDISPVVWQGYDHDAKQWVVPGIPSDCSATAYSAGYNQPPSSLMACPSSGPVGTVVTLTGTGCTFPGRALILQYLGPTDYQGSGGGGVSFSGPAAGGRFRVTFTIPAKVPEGGVTELRSVPVTPGPTYFDSEPTMDGCAAKFEVTGRN